MKQMHFQDKIVLITGVTRGIGRACAHQFSKAGAIIIGIYVSNDEAALEVRERIEEDDGKIQLYKGSVTNRDFVSTTLQDVYHRFGSIDVLINNAGKANDEMALFMQEEQWKDVINTNFTGAFHCMDVILPFMVKQGSGSIVNVASVSGVYGRETQTNYATSKGMIVGLTKLFARRHQKDGIQVCAIAPGMIETEMVKQVPTRKIDDFLQHTIAKRLGTPTEIADAICFLAHPRAAYLTGQVIKMDGGFLR